LSVVAYAVLFLAAPYVADFYRQAALTLVVRVAGCVVLLNAFQVVQVATLRRALNFRVEMKVNAISIVLSGVAAVVLAYLGAGVWSLVAQMLISAAVSSAILWFGGEWRPSPLFKLDSFKRLFGFGSNLALESMLEALYQNSSVLVIGRAFSAELTGLYFFATRLSNLLSQQLTSAVQRATFPALAIIQDDSFLLRVKYRQIIQLMMFLIAPLMLMLAAIAGPLFKLLFSPRWGGAVLYVELLTPVGVLYPLHAMNLNVLSVKGRSDLILKLGFVKKAVNVALLLAAIPFGVAGIVISQAIGSALALIPNTYYTTRLIDYGLKEQVTDVAKPIFAAVVAAIAANRSMLLAGDNIAAQLGVALVTGGVSYLLASFLLRSEGLLLALRKLPRTRPIASRTER
jgi:O-antigen/teichoic acid export membrane protein